MEGLGRKYLKFTNIIGMGCIKIDGKNNKTLEGINKHEGRGRTVCRPWQTAT
jgi:hypothetical protein